MSETFLPVLGTIGDLENATIATLMESACAVLGYTSNADGGEGIFVVGASAAKNHGTIITDLSGRTWYRETGGKPLSVKWFGAAGNGGGDDTNSIQLALNAIGAVSGSVYFPAGTYIISSTLTIPVGQLANKSSIGGIKIFGDGLGLSAIVNSTASIVFMSCTVPSGSYGFNLTVEGLCFVSSYASFNSYHVTTQNINRQVFRDCEFWTTNANENHVAGLKMIGAVGDSTDNFYAYVQNCTFEGSSISLDNITDSWITHNVIFATNGANTGGRAFGIELSGAASDIKIQNNHIASAPDGAIYIHAKSTSICISILGNFFDTAAPPYTSAPAIFVNSAQTGMLITGNCFSGVPGYAIDAVDLTFSSINGNSFYACGNTNGGAFSTILFSKSVSGTGCIGNVVYGNVFNQPIALAPQVYAILENSGSCTGHVYGMNSIIGIGYSPQAIGFGSPNGDSLLVPSTGLNTKSGGTIVISAPSTSATANHNLPYTPSPEDFSLTNISGWGASSKVWIAGVTATQFTINVDVAPGQNITFGYRLEYKGNLSDA